MVKEGKSVRQQKPKISVPVGKNTMVGFDEHLVRVMDQLTGYQPNLLIIPIVGMGGIGKTTLARNVFENKLVIETFDIRIWITISQEYSVQDTLLRILHDIGVIGDLKSETLAELRQRFHNTLFGRRYLIVMDDLWSIKAWDDFKFFFSDNGNGSRIMVTTRMSNVAVSVGSRNPYMMSLLDDGQSWNLFCKEVFGQESCSPELEGIGKRIAKGCRGLPLAIVAISGLLANSNMTREYWEFVARNLHSFANSGNDEHCLKILSLSYKHLPIHLKPCFLYMRVFPEDCEVRASDLIKLWIAEGFLKPIKAKGWEEVAKVYLMDLIDRNLIIVRKRSHSGRVKTCGIHDLLRDLCMRESHDKNFSGIPKVQRINSDHKNMCFQCFERAEQEMIHVPEGHLGSPSRSHASLLACGACRIMYRKLIRFRLVSTIKVITYQSSEKLLQPTKLRYLSLHCYDLQMVPPLKLLWNLQTLAIGIFSHNPIVLPSEIWEMPQLRHIYMRNGVMPDPSVTRDFTILENLQTLVCLRNFRCTQMFLERIPNLEKLAIIFDWFAEEDDWSAYYPSNLVNLHKLESLSLRCRRSYLEEIRFPYSLKKLKLIRCEVPWKNMSMIGLLPNLEVLKLYSDAFIGNEWNPVEGQFRRLKSLSINYDHYLVEWRAESIHFPVLESLQLWFLDHLKSIPLGIGEIATLHTIEVVYCSDSVIHQAKEILEEQKSFGNEGLQVYIDGIRYQSDAS